MANDYNQYAATKGRSYREPKALKEKYDKLCKEQKHFAESQAPWEVREAKRIERLIDEHFIALQTDNRGTTDDDRASPDEPTPPPRTRPKVSHRTPRQSSIEDNKPPEAPAPSIRRRGTDLDNLLHILGNYFERQETDQRSEHETAQETQATVKALQVEMRELRSDLRNMERRTKELESQLNTAHMQLQFVANSGYGMGVPVVNAGNGMMVHPGMPMPWSNGMPPVNMGMAYGMRMGPMDDHRQNGTAPHTQPPPHSHPSPSPQPPPHPQGSSPTTQPRSSTHTFRLGRPRVYRADELESIYVDTNGKGKGREKEKKEKKSPVPS